MKRTKKRSRRHHSEAFEPAMLARSPAFYLEPTANPAFYFEPAGNPMSGGAKVAIGVAVLAALGVGAYFIFKPKAAAAAPSASSGGTPGGQPLASDGGLPASSDNPGQLVGIGAAARTPINWASILGCNGRWETPSVTPMTPTYMGEWTGTLATLSSIAPALASKLSSLTTGVATHVPIRIRVFKGEGSMLIMTGLPVLRGKLIGTMPIVTLVCVMFAPGPPGPPVPNRTGAVGAMSRTPFSLSAFMSGCAWQQFNLGRAGSPYGNAPSVPGPPGWFTKSARIGSVYASFDDLSADVQQALTTYWNATAAGRAAAGSNAPSTLRGQQLGVILFQSGVNKAVVIGMQSGPNNMLLGSFMCQPRVIAPRITGPSFPMPTSTTRITGAPFPMHVGTR